MAEVPRTVRMQRVVAGQPEPRRVIPQVQRRIEPLPAIDVEPAGERHDRDGREIHVAGRPDPQRTAHVERRQRDAARARELGAQHVGDQETAQHEEDQHAEPAVGDQPQRRIPPRIAAGQHMLGMTDDDHRDRDGAQPGQLRDTMVHRLVSVGTISGQCENREISRF